MLTMTFSMDHNLSQAYVYAMASAKKRIETAM